MESLKQPCEVIQGLLIQKNFDELSPGQKEVVETHLQTCSGCHHFQSVLIKMNALSDFRNENKLVPPEIIYQRLKQRVIAKQKANIPIFQQGRELLKNLMNYRIPAYQVILAGVMILLIFFISRQITFEDKFKTPISPSVSMVEMPVVETMQVLNPHDVLRKQIIGQSVKEDTALYRFIITVM
ncbi:zf-HC2 domain-containing protein [candidate division KSB1 bacterium]|nr:zf-HC2 domain-containing protein [candidate division KSB1 bacterium]